MGTAIGTGVVLRTMADSIHAISTPMAPPTTAITVDSTRNCSRMSRLFAPSDLRMPISRVRSVTDASITFMITTPPMTRKIETSPTMPEASVPGKILPQAHQAVAGQDAEIVIVVGREMAPGAHQHPGLFLGARHPLRPARLNVDAQRVVAPVHLQPGLDGDVDEVVLRLSEGVADSFGDADHLELLPIDGDESCP